MLSAGRKPLPVCEACRLRKVKCDSVGVACRECIRSRLECVRTSAIRFKHHYATSGLQDDLEFPPGQAWTLPRATLRYHDETAEIVDMYQKGLRPGEIGSLAATDSTTTNANASSSSSKEPERLFGQGRGAAPNAMPIATSTTYGSQSLETSMSDAATLPAAMADSVSYTSWEQRAIASPHTRSDPIVSRDEAALLRNFADHMALWADATDLGRSFEVEATKRALTNPVLLYAICAFSSRHMNRNQPGNDEVALEYQNMCLQRLIPAMSDPQTVDETTLAAVAILRQNEEMDENDGRFHLEGTTRLLDHKSDFLRSGGLGEATAWLCLREDIYVSLLTQTPIRSNLDIFRHASWIRGDSDAAWASRMVLLLANLLSCIYSGKADAATRDSLQDQISDWHLCKPVSFQPLHYQPRNPAAGRFLPETWMLARFHAVGLQYYHIAQLAQVIAAAAAYNALSRKSLDGRSVEQQVRHHLLEVVGIAASTARAENTWFTAHHCLAVWGGFLREWGERRPCLDFLWRMEGQTGWRVGRLVERLGGLWEADGG